MFLLLFFSSFFLGKFLPDGQYRCTCHEGKTSTSEWVGLVPWSTELCPEMSVFVVYAKAVSRLRAVTYRADARLGK